MKVLFLQDHLKENHVKQVDGTLRNVYFQTQAGKILKRTAEETLNLKGDEYYIDYAYQLVPKVVQRDKFNRAIRYKKVSLTEARPEFELLYERIIREKPDIIVPQGNLGCSALLKKNGIKSLRGVPQKVVVRHGNASHETWVLPTFSIEHMLVDYKVNNLVAADFSTLGKYIEQGDVAFESENRDYEFVDSIKRVREIFKTILPAAPIVAWDLETNTLHPEKAGAKPLVISLSWQEGTGCTIPLEHKEFTWMPGHLAEIYEHIKAFVADPDIIKVGHNLQYDIRFLQLTKGFRDFHNHRDTKVMYYLLVDQDKDASLKLSNLSYEMTDMGGYDKPLEDFKKKYVEDYVAKERARINQLKEDYKKAVAKEKALAKKDKRKAQLPPKPKFPKVTPPVNEIDGSDFNYEWIPLESMLSPYASGDVDACLRIHNFLEKKGQAEENAKIRKLYTEHYTELSAYLAKVEAAGVQMNTDYTRGLIDAYTEEEDRLLQLIRKFPEVQRLEEEHEALYMKGLEEWSKPKAMRNEEIAKLRDKYKKKLVFNPNSPEDKQKALYKYTGYRLPYNKELVVKSAFEDGISEDELEWYHYKADKTALEYIKENFEDLKELADLLLTHSLVKTRKQNFTYKLLDLVNDKKRLYGTFNPTGTETTRLSSRDPNLQQIPRKTGNVKRFDYKHPIKRMFVTSFPGGALLQLDYSSLESRVLGLAAGDEEMTQQFLDGRDLHKETATFVYGVSMDQVTEDMRSMAKAVTFGFEVSRALI
ncbi:putative DNA polymerase [Bacillus phage BSP10]|nr:putative DNA polymerase [Bacillus phage BSP10]QRI44747.1 DNA polymerase I [Bacillus phage BSTP3]